MFAHFVIIDKDVVEGYELTIESGNNLLSFGEGGDSLATRIMYLLLGFLALSVLLFAVGGFFMYAKNNFSSLTPMEFIKYSVLLLIFVVLIIALINYIIDIIGYGIEVRLSKWGIKIPVLYWVRRSKTFIKFGTVGFSGTLVDFIFYKIFIHQFGVLPPTSKLFSTSIAVQNNFLLN